MANIGKLIYDPSLLLLIYKNYWLYKNKEIMFLNLCLDRFLTILINHFKKIYAMGKRIDPTPSHELA
jgi:hypothetical protein